jgi:hypothetical protein
MPFTLAHAVVAVPLRGLSSRSRLGRLGRLGLPMVSVVAGSVAPDLPLYLRAGGYGVTHSLWGVVTVDVVIGVTLVAAWVLLLRNAFADLTPWVRDRVRPRAPLGTRGWLLTPVGVALGALTHVVWDSASHRGGWIVQRVAWLQGEHLGLLGFAWVQHLSSVLGVSFLVGYTIWWLGRRTVRPRPSAVERSAVWFAAVPALAAAGGLTGFALGASLAGRAYLCAVLGVQAGTVAAVLVAAAWHLAVRRATDSHLRAA